MIKIITNIIIFLSLTCNQGLIRTNDYNYPFYFENSEELFRFGINKNKNIYSYIQVEKLVLNTKLTTLNEYINVERSNRYAAATVKTNNQKKISYLSKIQKFKLEKNTPFYVIIEWYNYRNDADNVEFAQKFIFDALQSANILKNDNKNFILQKVHFHLKDENTKDAFCHVNFFSDKFEFIEYFNNKILEND